MQSAPQNTPHAKEKSVYLSMSNTMFCKRLACPFGWEGRAVQLQDFFASFLSESIAHCWNWSDKVPYDHHIAMYYLPVLASYI